MSGEWFSCLIIYQLLTVSVVSTDKHLTVNFFQSVNSASYALVNNFYCFNCCCFHTGMSNHIRVSEVDDNHIIFVGFDRIYQFVTHFVCTHLRFKIVGCYLRGFNQDSVFALVRLFHTTVEEEGNVCIFFCLSDTSLCHVMSCQVLAECVFDLLFYECYQFVSDSFIVIGEAYKSYIQFFLTCETFKIIIAECSCDLTGTVRTEVEEYNGIFILHGCNRFTLFFDNGRQNELICLFCIVGSLYSFCSICSFYAFTLCHCFECQFYTIPTVISIHCIVTS